MGMPGRDRGVVLPMVIIFFVIMSTIGMSVIYLNGMTHLRASRGRVSAMAAYLADAGIERARGRIFKWTVFPEASGSACDISNSYNNPFALPTGYTHSYQYRIRLNQTAAFGDPNDPGQRTPYPPGGQDMDYYITATGICIGPTGVEVRKIHMAEVRVSSVTAWALGTPFPGTPNTPSRYRLMKKLLWWRELPEQ